MALAGIKDRVKKAQANTRTGEDLEIVAAAISRGAFYDELTDEEKNAYCAYMETEREALEMIRSCLWKTLHFQLTKRPGTPTAEEHRANVREVEAFFEEKKNAYNSPGEKAKRKAEALELQEIGRQRKAAYERGESWEAYPLPWERKRAEA